MASRSSVKPVRSSDESPPTRPHPVLTLSLPTPIGRVYMAATERALIRIELPDPNAEMRLKIWVALHFPHASIRSGVSPILKKTATQLEGYFTGGLTRFTLPCRLVGTEFQVAVWEHVRNIPFGGTRSYGEIAAALERPRAVRAVGAAQGANPLPIVIPCHRVIGADGTLTGYGGGLDVKHWLLEHESELPERAVAKPERRLHALAPRPGGRTPSGRRPGSHLRH
ncbi:MAG: methylated-DNA--[protein]-cysteine S-methyltransferase [Candidatus Binatia bacterium]